MIHGKKRNANLFKRLTESWGYTKPEGTSLDEQEEDVNEAAEEDVVEEEQEGEEGLAIETEGAYKREDKEEIEERARGREREGKPEDSRQRPMEEVEASGDEDVVEEAEEEELEEAEEIEAKTDPRGESSGGEELEEAIRRVVGKVLDQLKGK